MKHAVILMVAVFMTGCGTLIPKRVELLQDRVHKFPVPDSSMQERQRQAADRISRIPSPDGTQELGRSLSSSLGVPRHRWPGTSQELADKLDHETARYQEDVRDFQADNDQNAGKKIEGTGFLQVPYFVWLGGLLVMGFLGFLILTVVWGGLKFYAMSNPPLSMGLNAVEMGGRGIRTMATQLIAGGQRFKDAINQKIRDKKVREEVLETFRIEHERAQDQTTQRVVRHLKGK